MITTVTTVTSPSVSRRERQDVVFTEVDGGEDGRTEHVDPDADAEKPRLRPDVAVDRDPLVRMLRVERRNCNRNSPLHTPHRVAEKTSNRVWLVGVARFIDASIYRDTFPATRIVVLFFRITIFFFFF